MLDPQSSAAHSARQRILSEGCCVLAAQGVRGMTLRAVADRVGLSGAAISYHLGNKAALLAHVVAFALDRSMQRLARERGAVAALVHDAESLGDLLASHVRGRCEAERTDHGALLQAQAAHRFGGDLSLKNALVGWRRSQIDHWRTMLSNAGVMDRRSAGPSLDAAAWAVVAFLETERRYACVEPPAMGAILSAARCRRLAYRLTRAQAGARAGGQAGDPGKTLAWPSQGHTALDRARGFCGALASGAAPAGALSCRDGSASSVRGAGEDEHDLSAKTAVTRIRTAAIALIAEAGPAKLTHRRIADRAGVSLSSTTYHFAALSDIVRQAASALVEAIVDEARAVGAPAAAQGDTASGGAAGGDDRDPVARFVALRFAPPGDRAEGLRALQAMSFHAPIDGVCRDLLVEASLARGAIGVADIDGVPQRRLGEGGVAIDSLDAQILDTIAEGLELAYDMDPDAGDQHRAREQLTTIWGPSLDRDDHIASSVATARRGVTPPIG